MVRAVTRYIEYSTAHYRGWVTEPAETAPCVPGPAKLAHQLLITSICRIAHDNGLFDTRWCKVLKNYCIVGSNYL